MRAVGVWRGGYRTRLEDGRGHEVLVDLPRAERGTDAGTTALELCVASLAGCISTIFALVAEKRHLPYEGLTVTLVGERPEGAATLTAIEGTVHVTTSAPREDVETALRLALRTCPVGVLMERAGLPIRIRTSIGLPARAPAPPSRRKSGPGRI